MIWTGFPGGCGSKPLDAGTAKVVVAAIEAAAGWLWLMQSMLSTLSGAPITGTSVFDVVASRFTADNGGVCSAAVETVGGHVALPNGACWLHSHPDEQNVYDFTKYASVAIYTYGLHP